MSSVESYRVELINERVLTVRPSQIVLNASLEAGIPHYHVCGGNARCSTCRVLVEEGVEFLSTPTEAELTLAGRMGFPLGVRLACQTRVHGGPVRLHRLIRDQFDLEYFVRPGSDEATRSLGEERELALFFIDIRNFTPFAESHLPYDVIYILNRFFALVRKAVQSNGGTVIEVTGDGLYAVFGLEGDLNGAVAAAVQASRRIFADLEIINDTYLDLYFSHRLTVGIGLHVGRVIYGHLGIGVGDALSVIGYSVNVAARIQAATKQMNNSFLVSDAAFRLLTEPLENVASAIIELKGVAEPCKVFLLGHPYE